MKRLLFLLCVTVSMIASATTNRMEVLTVREDGSSGSFSNILGTVSQLAQLQAQIIINAKMAEQAENIYSSTTGMLARVAAQLVHNQAIGYADYFLVSFASAMIIDSSRDRVKLFKWEPAPAERARSGYTAFDCYYAFKGECDIQQLKQIFKVSGLITTPCSDWTYLDDADVDEPVQLGTYTDTTDNITYNYSYRTTVYFPETSQYFLMIHIRDQAADSDGSTLMVHGGDSGCLTGDRQLGDATIKLVGGRVVEWNRGE